MASLRSGHSAFCWEEVTATPRLRHASLLNGGVVDVATQPQHALEVPLLLWRGLELVGLARGLLIRRCSM
jgi:hypothetical protein